MWFRRLEIDRLRNLSDVRLELDPGLNYFYGPNGAGKTAVLEAVHLLARGRSFRSAQIQDVIRHGSDTLTVRADVVDEHRGNQNLGTLRHRSGRGEVRINGRSGQKLSEIAALLPLQVMDPGLSELVFGPPSERRRWLDWGTFHVKPDYLRALRRYSQVLRQRNAALKDVARGTLRAPDMEVWTSDLADAAQAVDDHRREYVEEVAPEFLSMHATLAPGVEVRIDYRRGWPEGEELRKILGDSLPREVKSGSTLTGPHRADIELRSGQAPAASTLSRGQGKILASALVLSQASLLHRTARRASVFLIDDVGAELDRQHSARFFEIMRGLGSQILATSAERDPGRNGFTGSETTVFHVERGRIHKVER